MDRVAEIEAAITNLPPDEHQRLADWFHSRGEEQMDCDSIGGKLDFLFLETESEFDQGLICDWPPTA